MGSVHPRAGGEHYSPPVDVQGYGGSSPRGRGTRHCDADIYVVLRFIPARAGNTHPRRPFERSGAVHPRAGGEHSRSRCCASNSIGSSPRGRGTHAEETERLNLFRFIPARAGNTASTSRGDMQLPVHPRAGGEHFGSVPPGVVEFGSSPRGRGTRRGLPSAALARSVHPRAGGEHGSVGQPRIAHDGSSPRGRGTRWRCNYCSSHNRFIPARAGNTGRAVHPCAA